MNTTSDTHTSGERLTQIQLEAMVFEEFGPEYTKYITELDTDKKTDISEQGIPGVPS